MTVVLNLVIMVGMFLVLPLGLRLLDGLPGWLPRLWLAGAVPGAVSLWLPRGSVAAGLAGLYLAVTLVLAAAGGWRWLRVRRWLAPRELAALTATLAPSVAGLALVAERSGFRLFGFTLRVLSLTVAHFHFAGFAAALIAALVCASTSDSAMGRAAALCVPLGTLIVLAGFFTSDLVELAGAAVLTAGMWLVGWLTWREVRGSTTDPATRLLLASSAAVLVVTMALALDWAAGRALALPHLSLDWMIATHGVANALGFALCAVLAWRRLRRSPQWKS